MKVLQANEFAKAVKKLPRQQKAVVDEGLVALYLLKLGSHENLYRDLKKERD
jgi:hypothetical protein